MLLAPSFLDELRARTTLSALIGKTVKLQKAGREFKACCPFHQEKTPSFYINDEKGFYHCFGCGAHGDAIRFLTETRGLQFMDAVKELAQLTGMALPAPDRLSREKAERASSLYQVMTDAADWFVERLGGLDGSEARSYLDQRGISEETRATFGLGLAPEGRNKLKNALESLGIDKLIESGLLIRPDEESREPYDRFRNRLMIPIRDPRGRVIAFGGRILGAGEPKYLNSPETPLFDKGNTLYNLDRAAPASRDTKRILVVEGYLDVIALDQAGIRDSVAPLGTALTEAQMERLWRLVEVPILCFDGDKAGRKAAVRAALRALPQLGPGRTFRFAMLPEGQDPDDLVRAGGAKGFEKVLERAISLDELLWQHELTRAGVLHTPEDRAGLGKRLRDHARLIKDQFLQKQYLGEFNRRLYDHFQGLRGGRFGKPSWKPQDQPLPPELRRIADYGIDRATVAPAIIKGLMRHPGLIAEHAETIARLIIEDRRLSSVQTILLEAALAVPLLDAERIETILKEEGLASFIDELQRSGRIAFSFLKSGAERERAKRDLAMVIEHLVAIFHIRKEQKRVLKLLTDAGDETSFAEQRRLGAAEQKLLTELAELALDETGYGSA